MIAFNLYLLFLISYFLRFAHRVPLLGFIHFDFLLIVIIVIMTFLQARERESSLTGTGRSLLVLCAVIIIALPFAQWPGTVVRAGIPLFIKVVVFYLFTVSLIRTERQLKLFMLVFIACQTIRILEPLYLHYTEGYWGGNTTFELNRLAGGPNDVINPNGLAEICVSAIAFYYFLGISAPWWGRVPLLGLLLPSLHAIILTGSRSGLIALLVVVVGIIVNSKRKILLLSAVVIGAVAIAGGLSDVQKDRYRSITDQSNERFGLSAQGRMSGSIKGFEVALDRPIFGHGLGTTTEVNFHKAGFASPAHNLYVEILQELGVIGLIVFLMYIWHIHRNIIEALRNSREKGSNSTFLLNTAKALQIWLWMNIVFGFASYGLKTWMWYLCGGLSVVLSRLIADSSYLRESVAE